jgi:hypothetical protein
MEPHGGALINGLDQDNLLTSKAVMTAQRPPGEISDSRVKARAYHENLYIFNLR